MRPPPRSPAAALVVGCSVALCASACELRKLDYLGNGQRAGTQIVPGCSAEGWCDLKGTHLHPLCPPPDNSFPMGETCDYVLGSHNSGVADLTGGQLVVWGGAPGGPTGYDGNEVYALNLAHPGVAPLTTRSPIDSSGCTMDGTPSARTTFDSLAYIESTREMFAFGGEGDCPQARNDTWTLDLSKNQWTSWTPAGGGPNNGLYGAVADYDPSTQVVLVGADSDLWSFSAATHQYAHLSGNLSHYLGMVGRVDPRRRLFVVLGGTAAYAFELSDRQYAVSPLALLGCDALVQEGYPGLAYDPVIDRFVAWWPGLGSTVYFLNMDTLKCTSEVLPNGPAPSMTGSALGHFRYFPAFDAFAVMDDVDQDAWVLRLGPLPPQ